MKSPTLKRQRTIKIDSDIIKITVTRKTSFANFVGWNIKVNDKKYFSNCLNIDDAFDKGYTRYVKENR